MGRVGQEPESSGSLIVGSGAYVPWFTVESRRIGLCSGHFPSIRGDQYSLPYSVFKWAQSRPPTPTMSRFRLTAGEAYKRFVRRVHSVLLPLLLGEGRGEGLRIVGVLESF